MYTYVCIHMCVIVHVCVHTSTYGHVCTEYKGQKTSRAIPSLLSTCFSRWGLSLAFTESLEKPGGWVSVCALGASLITWSDGRRYFLTVGGNHSLGRGSWTTHGEREMSSSASWLDVIWPAASSSCYLVFHDRLCLEPWARIRPFSLKLHLPGSFITETREETETSWPLPVKLHWLSCKPYRIQFLHLLRACFCRSMCHHRQSFTWAQTQCAQVLKKAQNYILYSSPKWFILGRGKLHKMQVEENIR